MLTGLTSKQIETSAQQPDQTRPRKGSLLGREVEHCLGRDSTLLLSPSPDTSSIATPPVDIPTPRQYECSITFQLAKGGLNKFRPLGRWVEIHARFIKGVTLYVSEKAENRNKVLSALKNLHKNFGQILDHLEEEEEDRLFFEGVFKFLHDIEEGINNKCIVGETEDIEELKEILITGKKLITEILRPEDDSFVPISDLRADSLESPYTPNSAAGGSETPDDLTFEDLF